MKIDRRTVEHVARLARIALSDREIERFSEQLSTIIDFFDMLKEVDTTDVAPTSHVCQRTNVFRQDSLQSSLPTENTLANAPEAFDRFFRVPKILV